MWKYPSVNYIGNKEKLSEWIISLVPHGVVSIFDAFSGGASIAYAAKMRGYQVYTNDILAINHYLSQALVENDVELLTEDDLNILLDGDPIEGFMTRHYSNVCFYPSECQELDLYRVNIDKLIGPYKKALAYSLLRRAMIRKMPYSRFTIKWDKIQELRDEEYSYQKYGRRRAYHNLPFSAHIEENVDLYNQAVFSNGCVHKSYNLDVFEACARVVADVIYLDPPYAGSMSDYYSFYYVLDEYIQGAKVAPFQFDFSDKKNVCSLFDNLFSSLRNFKYLMLSYNSRSYPSLDSILDLLRPYVQDVQVYTMPYAYKVTGKIKKRQDIEYLFVAQLK